MAFWQWWQPKSVVPSLPGITDLEKPRSQPWGTNPQRLPFDPLDCEELGVFALEQPVDFAPAASEAFDRPSFPAGSVMSSMAAVPMAAAAPKPFRPRRNVGTPGRRDGAGTH